MLALGALAGPFGGSLMLLAAGFLTLPASALFACAYFLRRRHELRETSDPASAHLGVFLFGWLAALALGAGMAALVAALPSGAQSGLAPFWTWIYLLAPFAVLGAVVSVALELRAHRQRQR